MADLTQRQREVLQAIVDMTDRLGWPPTLRELGEELGISSTYGVRCHLDALEDKGYIERQPNQSRAIRVLKAA